MSTHTFRDTEGPQDAWIPDATMGLPMGSAMGLCRLMHLEVPPQSYVAVRNRPHGTVVLAMSWLHRMGDMDHALMIPEPLTACTDVWAHSPLGFDWGPDGDPAGQLQLALALACTACGDPTTALRLHGALQATLVAQLDPEGWVLTRQAVLTALERVQAAATMTRAAQEPGR